MISGFLQAQGISVPLGQLEKLFGIKMKGYFIEQVVTFFQEVISTDPGPNWYDFGMGAGTMIFLILIKFLNDYGSI